MSLLWKAVYDSLIQKFEIHDSVIIESDGSVEWRRHQLLNLIDGLAIQLAAIIASPSSLSSETTPPLPARQSANPIVAVCLSNSALYVATVLASLKCGCAFLPITTDSTTDRLVAILQHAQPAALVCAEPCVPGGCAYPAAFSAHEPTHRRTFIISPQLLAAARRSPSASRQAAARPQQRPYLDYAYVLFTSGSTGAPLGVVGSETGIIQRCSWMEQAYPFQKETDVVAFKTAPTFVDSVWEVFGPLLAGVPMLTVPPQITMQPGKLLAALATHRVTHLSAVPSLWQQLLSMQRRLPETAPLALRIAVSSGEPLSADLLRLMSRELPQTCRILNLYGCTEVAADATVFDCGARSSRSERDFDEGGNASYTVKEKTDCGYPPVGQPLPGVFIALARLRENTNDGEETEAAAVLEEFVGEGEEGEVLIGGWGVAEGYLGVEEATSRRFVSLPVEEIKTSSWGGCAVDWEGKESAIMFRTGDVGVMGPAMQLRLTGRRDLQVKVNGIRINLEEVERAVSSHPAVHAAAAKAWVLPAQSAEISVFVELSSSALEQQPSLSFPETVKRDVLEWARSRLPHGALPSEITVLPTLPRSTAGKIARSALPPPHSDAQPYSLHCPASANPPAAKRRRQEERPRSETDVFTAFAAALGHADFEPTTSLFAAGGNSLVAAAIAAALNVDIEAVFLHPTVRGLSAATSSAPKLLPFRSKPEEAMPGFSVRSWDAAEPLLGSKSHLRFKWWYALDGCVDASPEFGPSCLWAASHDGAIASMALTNGREVWRSQRLQNRDYGHPDPGMVLCTSRGTENQPPRQYIAVGFDGGCIQFFDAVSGQPSSSTVTVKGGLRAAPAVDPEFGFVWAAGHAKELVVAAAPGDVVAVHSLPAAVSAGVAFQARVRVAYVACLNGDVCALTWGERGAALQVSRQWTFPLNEPIFATPTPLPDCSAAAVAVLGVTGTVVSLSDAGAPLWRCSAAPPDSLFVPALLVEQGNALLCGSHGGLLTWINAKDGSMLHQTRYLSEAITALSLAGSAAVAVATAEGSVLLIDERHPFQSPLDAIKLPGGTFSVAAKAGSLAIGCRDDRVYLFTVCPSNPA